MDYSDFAILGTEIRRKEKSTFDEKSDVELIALNQEQGKEDLKWDLMQALQMEIDEGNMEDYITDNLDYLREILAIRQLFWYYMENDGGEGSINRERIKFYDKMYKDKVSKLKSLLTEIPADINIEVRR